MQPVEKLEKSREIHATTAAVKRRAMKRKLKTHLSAHHSSIAVKYSKKKAEFIKRENHESLGQQPYTLGYRKLSFKSKVSC